MSNDVLDKKLKILVKVLRADTFHFILIGHNHPNVYRDVAEWLRKHILHQQIVELRISGKRYREVSDALRKAGKDIVLIPDFDELFTLENDALRIALNQRRDFLAFQHMNLLCFLSPYNFPLLPKKIPDLWSLRSLELDIVYEIKEQLFTWKSSPASSLGGSSIAEKEAEIRRLTYQISLANPNSTALLKELESQLVTLQREVPYRLGPDRDALTKLPVAPHSETNQTLTDKELNAIIRGIALLSIFAVLPTEPITRTILKELLPGINNLDATLQRLIKEGLIAFDEKNESFRCDSEILETTRQQNSERLFDDCKLLISTLIDKLDYQMGTGHLEHVTYETGTLYARYGESILQHIKKAEYLFAILAERVGTYHTTIGNLGKVLAFFERYAQLMKELYQQYPKNIELKRSHAASCLKLGIAHNELGNLNDALTSYDNFLQLSDELVKSQPYDILFKNDLTIAYEKLGNTHSTLGNITKALDYYQKHLALKEEIYNTDPNNVEFKNGLAISYFKLGKIHYEVGNYNKALTYLQKDIQLTEEAYNTYPKNGIYKDNLSTSFSTIAQIYTALHDFKNALVNFNQSLMLSKELYETVPTNISYKNKLAISYAMLGDFCRYDYSNPYASKNYYQQAETLWAELVKSASNVAEFKDSLKKVRNFLNEVR